ncbi:hypothetical protein FG385_09140 [Amycolatopsis alkalitolerans]|uniref:Uncharacterized protein n=1 Tax=Amycolatopsis alkalitolerans TaxID=2547244 RepID=A0A5C4M4B4_9PSEU|nr:hypothetical protein FG385_09140 [Amycolatopsis alkalitolerans]
MAAAAGVLALGAAGSPALAATNTAHEASGAVQFDPRCGCFPAPQPAPEKPAPAPEKPAPAPEQPAPAPEQPAPSEPGTGGIGCPAVVPDNSTGADYVNAWNQSGTCLGAGAAGLISSAWAGAIPSIIQGATGSVG